MRKSLEFTSLQKAIHDHFCKYFSQDTIKNIFKQLVLEILSYRPYNVKESIDEEEAGDRGEELSIYLLICGVAKELMLRFKETCLLIIHELIQEIPNVPEHLQCNIVSVLLVVPKVYELEEIPTQKILDLLNYLFSKPSLHKQFALVASRYCVLLVPLEGQKILNALVIVATTSTDI